MIQSLFVTQPTRIRIGVVGGGLVSQAVHLPELLERPDRFTVVGLADPSPGVRDAVADAWGIARTHADHRDLMGAGGIDALLVCSPNGTHARIALDALAQGLHVLVEKPLCLTVEDGERIAATAARDRLVAQVGYMKRFDPAVEALLAEGDEAGPLAHVVTETYDPGLRGPFGPHVAPGTDLPEAVRETVAEETSQQVQRAIGTVSPPHVRALSEVFLGALIHDVNLVRAALEPLGDSVVEILDAFWGEEPVRGGGTVALAGGARWTMVWLHLPRLGDFAERVVLYGRDGFRALEFPAPYLRRAPTVLRRSRGVHGRNETLVVRSWQEAYGRQLEHFHACVTEGATCRAPASDAVEDVRLLTALYRAAMARVPAEAVT